LCYTTRDSGKVRIQPVANDQEPRLAQFLVVLLLSAGACDSLVMLDWNEVASECVRSAIAIDFTKD
jgi:hypothetical protein